MLRYVIYAALSFTLNILIYLTAWLVAIIPAVVKAKRLPEWLDFLQTHDDDIYGSITTGEPIPSSVWGRWKRITWWLMRNPGYGFDAYVLGIRAGRVERVTWVGEKADGGIRDTLLLTNGVKRWGYRRDLFYSRGGKRYIKMWFGWSYKAQRGYHMLKFDFNPFKVADERKPV
jgi:hypothetical protein